MRYRQIILEVRFSNQEQIDYIIGNYGLSPIYDKIMKLLKKEKEYFKKPMVPDIKTDWDVKDTEMKTFVHFSVGDFRDLLGHIGDWLRVSGEYERARGAQSFRQMYQMADEYFTAKNKKASEEEDWENIEVVYEFPNGFKWVELKSKQALAREGKLMGHCVGDYCNRVYSGAYQVLSLRDKKNQPHVTIGLDIFRKMANPDFPELQIEQIQGKGNSKPDKRYIPYIKELLESNLNIKIFDNIVGSTGLIGIDGEIYDVNKLPDGLSFDGDLDLSFSILNNLPKNMYVNGNLFLQRTNLKEIPENLIVSKGLNLSESSIIRIKEGLKVGNDLDLSWTEISIIGFPQNMNIEIGGNLYMDQARLSNDFSEYLIGGIQENFRYLFRNLEKKVKGKIIR